MNVRTPFCIIFTLFILSSSRNMSLCFVQSLTLTDRPSWMSVLTDEVVFLRSLPLVLCSRPPHNLHYPFRSRFRDLVHTHVV